MVVFVLVSHMTWVRFSALPPIMGMSYNGSTRALGACNRGSIPRIPQVFFSFCSLSPFATPVMQVMHIPHHPAKHGR